MNNYRGKPPVLVWSLHMTGDWRSQLARTERWYERAVHAQGEEDQTDFLSWLFLKTLCLFVIGSLIHMLRANLKSTLCFPITLNCESIETWQIHSNITTSTGPAKNSHRVWRANLLPKIQVLDRILSSLFSVRESSTMHCYWLAHV